MKTRPSISLTTSMLLFYLVRRLHAPSSLAQWKTSANLYGPALKQNITVLSGDRTTTGCGVKGINIIATSSDCPRERVVEYRMTTLVDYFFLPQAHCQCRESSGPAPHFWTDDGERSSQQFFSHGHLSAESRLFCKVASISYGSDRRGRAVGGVGWRTVSPSRSFTVVNCKRPFCTVPSRKSTDPLDGYSPQ